MADKSGKKEKVSELDKNFQKTLQEIASNEKDFKTELEGMEIKHAREVSIEDGKNHCYLIQVSTKNEKDLKKVQQTLSKKLEDHFGKPVSIIPEKKRVNGNLYRKYKGTKVPRDRTLTALFDSYLEDLLYPAVIVGKRIRYPKGKVRKFKVLIDPIDKELLNNKIPSITGCYKALTNRELEIEFPENH